MPSRRPTTRVPAGSTSPVFVLTMAPLFFRKNGNSASSDTNGWLRLMSKLSKEALKRASPHDIQIMLSGCPKPISWPISANSWSTLSTTPPATASSAHLRAFSGSTFTQCMAMRSFSELAKRIHESIPVRPVYLSFEISKFWFMSVCSFCLYQSGRVSKWRRHALMRSMWAMMLL